MKQIAYLPKADDDLDGIYDYSVEQWGAVQADRYVTCIRARIDGLATGLTASRAAEDLPTGLRRALAERHVVFFREDAARVVVVRVLHQGMDVGRAGDGL